MGYDSLVGVQVSSYLVRYVVPFSYERDRSVDTEADKATSSYAYACKHLKDAKWKQTLKDKSESECYDYMRTMYGINMEELESGSTVGSIWELPINKKNEFWIKCVRDKDGQEELEKKAREKEVVLEAQLEDGGLYLLKNNIGLFWYEVKFKEDSFSLDRLVEFQNQFKELANREDSIQLCYKGEFSVLESCTVSKEVETKLLPVTILRDDSQESKKDDYHIPYDALPAWMQKDALLNACSYEKIILTEEEARERGVNKKTGDVYYKVKYEIPLSSNKLGVWVNQILSCMDCEIGYYPSRKHEKKINIPDKALLFNYCSVDEMQLQEKQKADAMQYAAFYLTKGFKKSYRPPVGFEKEMLYPFQNIIWYAQKEGCGIYVSYSDDNDEFLSGDNMKGRVQRDYFHLYMTLVQQSFVLLRFSEEITRSISANKHEYVHIDNEITKKLEDVQRRINLFLVKNMYASIGFTNHHNQFYAYIERVLNIKSDIAALNSGVAALDELLLRQKEQREKEEKEAIEALRREKEQREKEEKEKEETNTNRMQIAFALVSILSIVSLPKNFFDLVETYLTNGFFSGKGIVFTIFVVGMLVLGAIMIKFYLPVWSKMREEMRKEKQIGDK